MHFVEISGWSTHDTMNYSDAPAKLDELQASHGFLKCRKNSRAELVPSPWANARNGASRRWLGDKTDNIDPVFGGMNIFLAYPLLISVVGV